MYILAFQVSTQSVATNNSLFSQWWQNNFLYVLYEDTDETKHIAAVRTRKV